MARRPVAGIAAVVLIVEAVGIVLLQSFLGLVVDEQQMSLAGLDPSAMSIGTVIGGFLFGGYLLLCAVVLLRAAIRDRAPAGFLRLLLIAAAVVHGLIGAVSVGLVGWPAFVFMMITLGLLVWTLVSYGEPKDQKAEARTADPEPSPGPPPPAPAL